MVTLAQGPRPNIFARPTFGTTTQLAASLGRTKRSRTFNLMGRPRGSYRWVLEGFRDDVVQRWECDDLEDEVVAEHLGLVPEALWDIKEPFFNYLMNRYGFDATYADFDEVLIGAEQAG